MNKAEPTDFVEFEILKEPWNTFQLSDGTLLKLRLILQKVRLWRDEGGKSHLNYTHNLMVVSEVPEKLLGPKDEGHQLDEIKANIVEENIKFEPVSVGDFIYRLSDGRFMTFNVQLVSVSRSSLYGEDGEPLYAIDYQEKLGFPVGPETP